MQTVWVVSVELFEQTGLPSHAVRMSYTFLKKQAGSGAPASRLKAIFEAAVFARHVLGLDELQAIVSSRRCLGATAQNVLRGP